MKKCVGLMMEVQEEQSTARTWKGLTAQVRAPNHHVCINENTDKHKPNICTNSCFLHWQAYGRLSLVNKYKSPRTTHAEQVVHNTVHKGWQFCWYGISEHNKMLMLTTKFNKSIFYISVYTSVGTVQVWPSNFTITIEEIRQTEPPLHC